MCTEATNVLCECIVLPHPSRDSKAETNGTDVAICMNASGLVERFTTR
jgi:mannitol/fructose-specific phosphotransferase system IIA component